MMTYFEVSEHLKSITLLEENKRKFLLLGEYPEVENAVKAQEKILASFRLDQLVGSEQERVKVKKEIEQFSRIYRSNCSFLQELKTITSMFFTRKNTHSSYSVDGKRPSTSSFFIKSAILA